MTCRANRSGNGGVHNTMRRLPYVPGASQLIAGCGISLRRNSSRCGGRPGRFIAPTPRGRACRGATRTTSKQLRRLLAFLARYFRLFG